MTDLKEWAEHTQTTVEALAVAVNRLREDMTKTNEASLKENMAWSMTDRMVTQMNDLLGMQQTQIRDLVRQVGALDKALMRHLEEMGYSE